MAVFEFGGLALALFPGSPLTPMEKKNRRGERATDSHLISRHHDVTAIIAKIDRGRMPHPVGGAIGVTLSHRHEKGIHPL